MRDLPTIAYDRETSNANKAAECLSRGLWEAAQTFALLAIADSLTSPGSGMNVAEIVAAAGGIQA